MFRNLQVYCHKGSILAVNHFDDSVRYRSSSGGAFYALAHYVLEKKGVVIGAAYNGTDVEHIAVTDVSDLWKLQKSKYAPSSLSRVKKIIEETDAARLVLFSGTPCQVKSQGEKLRKKFKHLLLVEIACHGVPTLASYRDYIAQNNIVKIDFRHKRSGWKEQMIEITRNDGSVLYEPSKTNSFYQRYLSGEIIRKACFSCTAKYFSSGADITLADAWGINDFAKELDDNRGSSLVFLHSSEGRAIWKSVSNDFCVHPIGLTDAIRYNSSIVRPLGSSPLLVERICLLKETLLIWGWQIMRKLMGKK